MRPRCNALRYAYRAAAEKIRTDSNDVTIQAIADELTIRYKIAQVFLYNNPELAEEIGLIKLHEELEVEDYRRAIESIPADVRPSLDLIGKIVNRAHTTVKSFLENHPELKKMHPLIGTKWECVRSKNGEYASGAAIAVSETEVPLPVQEQGIAEAEPEETEEPVGREERWWRDILVNVWDENSCRYAGIGVTRKQYLEYWERGLLQHLHKKESKPKHLPTPQEVALMR